MNTLEREENRESELFAKLEVAIEGAKDACERLEKRAAAALKATDKVIRKNPYPAIGISLGLGLLIGVLVMHSRND
jgi:ElaB/YqjD/DUF883 family membrane-anchored ribosome-binding protein